MLKCYNVSNLFDKSATYKCKLTKGKDIMTNKKIFCQTEYLLSIAITKCGNLEDAQDITQDTMLSALAYVKRGGTIENPQAFLSTLLNRKYYDMLRRKYKLPTVTIGENFDVADDSNIEETLISNEEAENIINLGKEAGFNIYLNKLKAEDWENGWKKYYSTFNITENIVVVPAWEDYDKKDGEMVIILDSGMAFGPGTHETTKMCVSYIEECVNEDTKVLDIGTGSGILSIASALYGAKEITAIDIDELAVKIAKENVMINEKEDVIEVKQGDLLKDIDGKFDVIIANIVADIIKILIPDIRRFLNENGTFIISGIIKEREQEVYDFAIANGFTVENVNSQGGWSAMKLV